MTAPEKNSYSIKDAKWHTKQVPEFEPISFSDFEKKKLFPQIALIVATEIEHEAVLKSLHKIPGENVVYLINYRKQTYHIGQFGAFLAIVLRAASAGAVGPAAAITSTIELIIVWNPSAVISVGIAMGSVMKKHKEGDVLISTHVINYESEKISKRKAIDRSSTVPASQVLLTRFQNTFGWTFKRPDSSACKRHYGRLLSGEKLINDPIFKAKLLSKFPEAIGAEMEASGIWSACDHQDKEWIIIKSVCDWGDGNKNDEYQHMAAASAVSLCEFVFKSSNALDGIAKVNYKAQRLGRINSLKMFFFRNDRKRYSIKKLTHITGIPTTMIQHLERIDPANEFSIEMFPKCSVQNIAKIEDALKCPRGFLNAGNVDDFHSAYLIYFIKNSGQDVGFLKQKVNIKAVVFDFDGTLTVPSDKVSTWERIWLKLGYSKADCAKYLLEFKQGRISHQQWCDITCEHFQNKGFSKQHLLDLASSINLLDGVLETLEMLTRKGIKLYITSGSILDLIHAVLGDNSIKLFESVMANKFEYSADGLLNKIVGTKYDFEGKARFITELISKKKINPFEILFIGNSDNDDWAYKSGAQTLCVNPNNTVFTNARRWHHLIKDMKSMHEILPLIVP